MIKTVSRFSLKEIIFFVMMWVFYSLNSKYLRIPSASTIRWVLMGVLLVLTVISMRGKITIPPSIVIAFVAAVLPSFVYTVDLHESVIKFLNFIVVVWGGYFYFSSLEKEEDYYLAMKMMMTVMLAFAIQNIICILIGVGYDGMRACGVTTNANTLGVYSNLSLLAAYYFATQRQGIKKLFYICLMVISIYMALASGSRIAFVVLIINFFLMVAVSEITFKLKIFCFISMSIFLILVINGGFFNFKIEALERLLSENGTNRGDLWILGINVWRKFPVFGCGYAISQYYNNIPSVFHARFHNSYITILAEIGVWGCTILGCIFLFYGKNMINTILRKKREEKMLMITLLMLLVLLITAYSESFLFAVGSAEGCTFWLIFTWGIAYCQYRNFYAEDTIGRVKNE